MLSVVCGKADKLKEFTYLYTNTNSSCLFYFQIHLYGFALWFIQVTKYLSAHSIGKLLQWLLSCKIVQPHSIWEIFITTSFSPSSSWSLIKYSRECSVQADRKARPPAGSCLFPLGSVFYSFMSPSKMELPSCFLVCKAVGPFVLTAI